MKETWYYASKFGVRREKATRDGERLRLVGGTTVPIRSPLGHYFAGEKEANACALDMMRKAVTASERELKERQRRLARFEQKLARPREEVVTAQEVAPPKRKSGKASPHLMMALNSLLGDKETQAAVDAHAGISPDAQRSLGGGAD